MKFTIDENGVLSKYEGSEEIVTVPAGVTAIGAYVFSHNTNIKRIILPDCLQKIGDDAFAYSSLEAAAIPEGVTELGIRAFLECSCLESAYLPDTVHQIPAWMFKGCRSLRAVHFPAGLEWIGQEAFACTALKELILPAHVSGIGVGAFANIAGLEQVVLSPGIKGIEQDAFSACKQLKCISLPKGLFYIGSGAFRGCSALHEVSLPDSLLETSTDVFRDCGCFNHQAYDAWLEHLKNGMEIYKKPEGYKMLPAARLSDLFRSKEGKTPLDLSWYYYFREEKKLPVDAINQSFQYDGRYLCSDVFQTHHVGKYSKALDFYVDRGGNPVLRRYSATPTFDSGDREWDSYSKFYLVWHAGRLTGFQIRGGYKLASVSLYTDMRPADERTRQLLSYAGLPETDLNHPFQLPHYNM